MTAHRLHGLSIHSELDLGDAVADVGEPDLVVERAPTAPEPEPGAELVGGPVEPGRLFYELFEEDAGWTLRLPAVGFTAWLARDLRRVRVHATAEHEALAPVLTAGAVLGLLLDLRGDIAMHASAIDLDGAAVAFTGPSNAGKTTTAALTCAAGALLVADDLLRISVGDAPPRAHRGAGALRLRAHAAGLSESARALATTATPDGRVALRLPPTGHDVLPLRAVVVPRPDRGAGEVRLDRLPRPAALALLASSGRYVGWRPRERRAAQFHRAAALEEQVPVIAATLPWSDPVSPELGPLLLDALRAL